MNFLIVNLSSLYVLLFLRCILSCFLFFWRHFLFPAGRNHQEDERNKHGWLTTGLRMCPPRRPIFTDIKALHTLFHKVTLIKSFSLPIFVRFVSYSNCPNVFLKNLIQSSIHLLIRMAVIHVHPSPYHSIPVVKKNNSLVTAFISSHT